MPELLEMLPSDLLEETQQRFYIKRKGRIEVRTPEGEIIAMLKTELSIGRELLYIVADAVEGDEVIRSHFSLH